MRSTWVHVLLAIGMGLPVLLHAATPQPISWLPEITTSDRQAELGKRLFFDPRLSASGTHSCASCHDPDHGFASDQALTPATPAGRGFRNVPGLINTVHKRNWGRDGRHDQLEQMIGEMISDPFAMGMDPHLLTARLQQDPVYRKLSQDAGIRTIDASSATRALMEFLGLLTSKNAPVDTGMLSESARRGKALFEDKAGCMRCHHGPLLSDGLSHGNGSASEPSRYQDPAIRQALIHRALGSGHPDSIGLETDPGRMLATGSPHDLDTWITPGLREVGKTGPYMHDGRFSTLAEVVEFYYFGEGDHINKDPQLQPLAITLDEMNDLLAFLDALSGRDLNTDRYVWKEQWPQEYPAEAYISERIKGQP